MADPESAGAKRGEVLDRVKCGIGDMVDFARVLQVIDELGDDRQQRLLIKLVPGEGLQEEQNAVLVSHHPDDELLEIPPAVLGSCR